MEKDKISLFVYVIFGIVFGAISFYLQSSLYGLVLMIVGLFAIYAVLKKALKSNEKMKWFITNGGWIYIFVWFISWTILYNVYLV